MSTYEPLRYLLGDRNAIEIHPAGIRVVPQEVQVSDDRLTTATVKTEDVYLMAVYGRPLASAQDLRDFAHHLTQYLDAQEDTDHE